MTADTAGGVWTYALELAGALGSHAIEVFLATMGGPAPKSDLPANVRLFESNFRLEWMQDPWDDVRRAGEWLLDLEHKLGPDLIHLNNYAHGSLPWNAPVVMVGHSCVLSWWKAVHGTEAPAEWDRYREEVRRGLQSANIVMAPSRTMLGELERYYGPFRDARVVANGIRMPVAHGSPLVQGKERFVFCAGRLWDAGKNVVALSKASKAVRWPIYVAGENGTRARGLRYAGQLTSKQITAWYARASIYALPAKYEPFGLSVLEAALSRCALVLGDVPSLRENWDCAAIFVDRDDPRDLSVALNRLIDDDVLRRDLADKAYARALEFTPERMAEGYLAAYRAASESMACA